MGEKVYTESEYRDAIVNAQMNATKLTVQIFDEAYLLGRRHAEAIFNKNDEGIKHEQS